MSSMNKRFDSSNDVEQGGCSYDTDSGQMQDVCPPGSDNAVSAVCDLEHVFGQGWCCDARRLNIILIICKENLKKEFDCNVIIENDANLFSLGEWFLSYQEEDIFLGVTVGTGLGFGLIIAQGNNMPNGRRKN